MASIVNRNRTLPIAELLRGIAIRCSLLLVNNTMTVGIASLNEINLIRAYLSSYSVVLGQLLTLIDII